jgi:hypothetical protein
LNRHKNLLQWRHVNTKTRRLERWGLVCCALAALA